MSIELDPTAYDVDELRRLAAGVAAPTGAEPNDSPASRPASSSARTPVRDAQLEALLSATVHGEASRPYLRALPASYAAEVLVDDWCSFLLEQGGFALAYRSLARYRERGWLGGRAHEQLRTRLTGLADGHDPRPVGGSLETTDHRLSLVYVARLATLEPTDDTETLP